MKLNTLSSQEESLIAHLARSGWNVLADATTPLSQLDPEQTATALQNIPTLILHARSDHIVPARYGRRLQQLIPHAELWSSPFGHTTLFLTLPARNARITRWINTHATLAATGNDGKLPSW